MPGGSACAQSMFPFFGELQPETAGETGEGQDDTADLPDLGDEGAREKAAQQTIDFDVNPDDLPDFSDFPALGDAPDSRQEAEETRPQPAMPASSPKTASSGNAPSSSAAPPTEEPPSAPPAAQPSSSRQTAASRDASPAQPSFTTPPSAGQERTAPAPPARTAARPPPPESQYNRQSPPTYGRTAPSYGRAAPRQRPSQQKKKAKKKGPEIDLGVKLDKPPKKKKQDLQKQLQKRRRTGTNAAVFDVAGLMLGMGAEQAQELLEDKGYKLLKVEYDIPNFLEWKYEEWCESRGVVGFENVANCVTAKAKQMGHRYVHRMSFEKYSTRESVDVTLTSSYTDNRVYRITYRSEGDPSLGSSPKAIYQRHDRLRNFWLKVYQKYGPPDEETQNAMIWSKGYGTPELRASHGQLVLENPDLIYKDQNNMIRADKRMVDEDMFTF